MKANLTQSGYLLLALVLVVSALLFLPDGASGQVVINAPPEVIGDDFEVNNNQTLNVGEGGIVGSRLESNAGSAVNISGGEVGSSFSAQTGSTVEISGGFVDGGFNVRAGAEVDISGGIIESLFAYTGSTLNVTGGSIEYLNAYSDSDVELFGGDFRLNGAPYPDNILTLGESDVLSGTLADGSSFAFKKRLYGRFSEVTLTSTALPSYDLTPILIDSSIDERFKGLRAGQTLTIREGGELMNDLVVIGGTLNIEGELVESNIKIINGTANIAEGGTIGGLSITGESEVNISGGYFRNYYSTSENSVEAYDGSTVNISGGNFWDVNSGSYSGDTYGFYANSGSTVNITGGDFSIYRPEGEAEFKFGEKAFRSADGSLVNIQDGTFGDFFVDGGTVNISGGAFGSNGSAYDAGVTIQNGGIVNLSGGDHANGGVSVSSDSKLNLTGGILYEISSASEGSVTVYGKEFIVDGMPISNLLPGEFLDFVDLYISLEGKYGDGSEFNLFISNNPRARTDAHVRIILLTELEGDYNNDGIVDAADYTVWQDNLGGTFSMPNETVTPGVVTEEDYEVYANNFGAKLNVSVPEPASVVMLLIGSCSLLKRRS